jgi:antagonist of KipI
VEPVLGSRSTYLPGGFGGYEGRVLKRGDRLPLAPGSEELSRSRYESVKNKRGSSVRWSVPPFTVPDREPIVLHAIEGEHFADFDANNQKVFFDTVWKVTPDSNRMGYRLAGQTLARSRTDEILSGPTCLGSVQVPPSGVPIALMADHQTTGGYPRIAEIASADIPRLAQIAPGGTVHFARCSLEMAAELRKDARTRLETVMRGIAWEYGK